MQLSADGGAHRRGRRTANHTQSRQETCSVLKLATASAASAGLEGALFAFSSSASPCNSYADDETVALPWLA